MIQEFFPQHPDLLVAGLLLAFLLLASFRLAFGKTRFPHTFTAKVDFVCDGDSIWVRARFGRKLKLRLAAMDAPEYRQPFGRESGKHLAQMIRGKTVTVTALARDPYGRLVSRVHTEDGRDVSHEMIAAGFAWAYPAYFGMIDADERTAYEVAEENARRMRLGLWQQENPTEPWQWRKEHRSLAVTLMFWLKRLFMRLFGLSRKR